MVVHARFSVETQVTTWNSGWGYGWGWGPTTTQVTQIPLGTMIVDLVDAKNNQLVWRGIANDTLQPGKQPEEREKKLRKVMAGLFAGYPPTAEVSDPFALLEDRLGHRFVERELLVRALTHASFANEAEPAAKVVDNETLEFLGDSVLGFLVAERLFRSHPDWEQGTLTKARAEIVSEASLAETARRLDLGPLLRLASSDERSGGRDRDARLADALEAVVAGVFLDGGLEAARIAVARLFDADLDALEPEELLRRDAKSALQERAQAEGKALPRYRLLSESGPDHEKRFVYEVRYGSGDELFATGEGASKKEAQRAAARAALDLLSARGG